MKAIRLAMLFFALGAGECLAVNPDEMLSDPVLEGRARAIGSELRCLVCQNQSIDDSNSGLARDLRVIVRERLVAGDSDDMIKSYVAERFGNYVLLKPPFSINTVLLWIGPLLVLLAALSVFVISFFRSRSTHDEVLPLSPEEAKLVQELQENI